MYQCLVSKNIVMVFTLKSNGIYYERQTLNFVLFYL